MVGRIREIVFEDGIDVDGTVTEAASKDYVDGLFDPITANEKGIYLDNTSGLPALSPWRAGVLAWDTEHDCLAVSTIYEDSWLQVGSEEQETVRNKTGSDLLNGQVVYIDGATGHIPNVKLATCTDETIAKRTIGVVTSESNIANNDTGPICLSGHVHGINTNSFTVGDVLWLDTVAGGFTATRPSYQYEHIMIGIVLEKSPTDGVIYVEVRDLTDQIAKMGFHTVDPHGFTEYDNTYMTRSWVGNTFTLTQVGTSTPYYHKGKLKYLTGNKSITVTPTAGAHFIGLNCTTEVLEDLGGTIPAASVVSTHVICEFCYANGTDVIYYANERHSTKFPKKIWFFNHLYLSTQYKSGLTTSITSIDGNGSSLDHARFSVTAGVIQDEDIEISVASIASAATKNIWYYNGTVWVSVSETNGTGVIVSGTGRASYNNYTTGLVEATNNYHVLTHLFAANNGTVIAIIGNAEYQLLAQARVAASEEISTLLTTGLPFPEFRAIATFINQTRDTYSNAVKSRIVSVDTGVEYIDWRTTKLNPVAGTSASNHNSLAGIQGGQAGEYYHITASDYNNIINKIYPGGAAADTGAKVILPTKADTIGLTPTAGNVIFDTTKKKLQAGDGAQWKVVGGGLVVTPITVSGTTPSISSLESGKHYIVDMSTATGDVNLDAPAGESEANFKVTATRNYTNSYRVTVTADGSDKFYYVGDSLNYDAVRLYNPDQWIEFCYLTTNVWIMNTDENSGSGGSSGTGRKNYIKNPSAFTSFTDYWTATNFTVSRDTSTSIPRETTTGTAFKLVSTAGSSTATFLSDAILLDDADLSKKLGIEIAINIADSSNWSIDILASATSGGTYARLPLSTDSSSITYLPATTGTFKTTVDMVAATPYIKFRITSVATSKTAYFSDIIVTPDSNSIQGAVVGPATKLSASVSSNSQQANAIAIGGSTTAPAIATSVVWNDAYYYRDGQYLVLNFNYCHTNNTGATAGSGTYYFRIPSGLTIDSSILSIGDNTSRNIVGSAQAEDNSKMYTGTVQVVNTTSLALVVGNETTTPSLVSSVFLPFNTASNYRISFQARIPIAEWAGSGTVNLASNDVEYAYNFSTTTTDDTTSFGYGPTGALIKDFAPSGTNVIVKGVQFQTPIQNSDVLMFEVDNGSGKWQSFVERIGNFSENDAGSTAYGYRIEITGTTTASVQFFSKATVGAAWSAINTWRWRVRKSSAGAAVGFGIVQPGVSAGLVSASGLPGRTDGQAIAAGYVGENLLTAGGSITSIGASTITTLDTVELPSTGGVFLVTATFSNIKVTANGGLIYGNISLNSGGYVIQREERFTNDSGDLITSGLTSFPAVINIASGLTAAQRTVAARVQATSTVTGEAQGRLMYVRIA
jgi:hypothetical protein